MRLFSALLNALAPKYRYDHLKYREDAARILNVFLDQDQMFWQVVYDVVMEDTGDEQLAISEAWRSLAIKIATETNYSEK